MKKLLKLLLLPSALLFSAPGLPALEVMNLWRHSEIAGKNSVFADIGFAPLMLENVADSLAAFEIFPLDVRLDWLPPIPLPFSAGVFFKTPNPNLRSFGVRLAYHFDLLDPFTDLYFLYSFDFGFLRNDLLEQFNDEPAEAAWHDFRAGVRRFFGRRVGVALESGFKFQSVIFLITIKIN